MTTYYKRRKPRYPEKLKKEIVKEAMSGDESLASLANRYKVGKRSISRWLNHYEKEFISTLAPSINEESKQMSQPPKSSNQEPEDSKEMDLRLRELEEALRLAKLKSEAYEHLIKLAEEQYKISIKKKYGTK